MNTERIKKLNLLWDGHPLSGHLNIDPFGYSDDRKVVGNVKNLDNLVENSEVSDIIIAEDVVDFLYLNEVEPALHHWVSKMAVGCRIIIGGVDLYDVSKAFARYEIDLQTTNIILHGHQNKPWKERHVNYSLIGMCQFFQDCGLKVLSKKAYGYDPNDVGNVKNFHYYVEGVKMWN